MGRKEQSQCQYYREQLVKDRERLADLEERGDAACSAYDLSFGYNAEFSKQLKRNHILHDLKQLEKCPPVLIEADKAITTPVERVSVKTRPTEQPQEQTPIESGQTVFQQGRLL